MRFRLAFVGWITVLFIASIMAPMSSPQNVEPMPLNHFSATQTWDNCEGTIPMDIVTIVGDVGDSYSTAMSQIAAMPLNVRSNGKQTAAGLLLPDDILSYASPLDEWLNVAGNSINELVYVGDISNPVHTALTAYADATTSIVGNNHFEIAGNIAEQFFQGTDSVVIALAEDLATPYTSSLIHSVEGESLDPPTGRLVVVFSGTGPSNDWELLYDVTPSGGGLICDLESDPGYMWFDMLAERGGEYYSLDYAFTSAMRVRYPYERSSADTWYLHVIDMYEYSRTLDIDFRIRTIDADIYTVNVAPGEDCNLDIQVDFRGAQVRGGVHVLGPTGEIVLNANRFSMLTEFPQYGRVYDIQTTLAHPAPGNYEIFVTNSEDFAIDYDLNITKRVVADEWQASAASGANAASIASYLGAPILFMNENSLPVATNNALDALQPENVWIVDPLSGISSTATDMIRALVPEVNEIKSFQDVHNFLADATMQSRRNGRVTLYDSQGTYFAPAALSAAKRQDVAIPFHYDDSGFMTLSQIPEQIAYNRDYTVPFGAEPSIIGAWSTDGTLSNFNPPYDAVVPIANAFFPWLNEQTGITTPTSIVTIAPYSGCGSTLPAVFERAISGRTQSGRYPSVNPDATMIQIMRSILRIPLQSAVGRAHTALGSYLVYADGLETVLVDLNSEYPRNTIYFNYEMNNAGLNSTLLVGPSVSSYLMNAPYLWIFSTHGAIGDEMYTDDGAAAMTAIDYTRGFDDGYSEESPDDGDGIVNPSIWDSMPLSSIWGSADVNGMIAILDSCQLGSSYGPALLMESGSDAVAACWTDCLTGQSDYLEGEVVHQMVSSGSTFGEGLNLALEESSHVYSEAVEAIDFHITSSDADVIGASLQQFIIFGDPEVTMYDWDADPYPMCERASLTPAKPFLRSQPGALFTFPIGYWDPVGHIYPIEGTFQVDVQYPDETMMTTETVDTSGGNPSYVEFTFPGDAPLGMYTLTLTETVETWSVQISIVLEWAEFTILSLEVLNIRQLDMCTFTMSVHNPLDSPASGIVTVRIGQTEIHREERMWDPLTSSQTVEFLSLYPPSGSHDFVVTLHNPAVETSIASLSVPVSLDVHWTLIALLTIVPFFGLTAVSTSFLVQRKSSKISGIADAYEKEYSNQLDDALDFYLNAEMLNSSTRVVSKLGFSEIALLKLNSKFGSRVHPVITNRAAELEASGVFDTAAHAYRILNDTCKALSCQVRSDLKNGAFSDAASGFGELVSDGENRHAMEIVSYLLNQSSSDLIIEFVKYAETAVFSLATQIGKDPESLYSMTSALIELVEKCDNPGIEMSVKVALGRFDSVTEMILAANDVDGMIELTRNLHYDQKVTIAESVSRGLKEKGDTESIAPYLAGLDLEHFDLVRLSEPLIEALFAAPGSRKLNKALKSISATAGPDGIPEIDQALDSAKQLLTLAKKKGVKPSNLNTFDILDLLSDISNQEAIRPLFEVSEGGFWKGASPEDAELGLLAEFTQRLREEIYGHELGVKHFLTLRLEKLEGILVNRLKQQAVEVLQNASMKGITDLELKQSAVEIANQLLLNLGGQNPSASVKALQTLLDEREPAELRGFAERGVMRENPDEILKKTLSPAEIALLLQRHRVVRRRFDGTYVLEQDLVGATREVMSRLIDQWTRSASGIWKSGVLGALKRITLDSMTIEIPTKQKELIASYCIESSYKHAESRPIENAAIFLKEMMDSGPTILNVEVALEQAKIPQDVKNRIKEALG